MSVFVRCAVPGLRGPCRRHSTQASPVLLPDPAARPCATVCTCSAHYICAHAHAPGRAWEADTVPCKSTHQAEGSAASSTGARNAYSAKAASRCATAAGSPARCMRGAWARWRHTCARACAKKSVYACARVCVCGYVRVRVAVHLQCKSSCLCIRSRANVQNAMEYPWHVSAGCACACCNAKR